jgi:Flp pilus assembly protein CpaB
LVILRKYAHILLGLLLAATAGFLVWYIIDINTPSVPVVKAQTKLPVGTVIDSRHITVENYPKAAVPPDAVHSKAEAIGKTVFEGPVLGGDVIRKQHLEAKVGSLRAKLNALAPGREAVDLPAGTATGLKGVAVGDRVDVYGEVEVIVGQQVATRIERVAHNAVVLQVPGTKELKGPEDIEEAFVIAVLPEEAQKVAGGIVRGKKFSITLLSTEVK